MTNTEVTSTATIEVSNPITAEVVKPVTKKAIPIKEYLKSFLFLVAIYSLIINQAQNDKPDTQSSVKEIISPQYETLSKKNNEKNLLLSMIYSGVSIIFLPTHTLLWK